VNTTINFISSIILPLETAVDSSAGWLTQLPFCSHDAPLDCMPGYFGSATGDSGFAGGSELQTLGGSGHALPGKLRKI